MWNTMDSWFGRQPAPLLGLDIGCSGLKLVELSQGRRGRLRLERCALEPLPQGWIVDGSVERFDEVAQAMRRLVGKSGTRTRNVAMALPAAAVITKRIALPAGMSEQELEVQVESEASRYIPFSLDEVSLDFCVLGPCAGAAAQVEVLIAASRREKVQDRQGLAEAAGLKPMVIEIEPNASRLAAARLIERLPDKGADAVVALFEVGSVTTSMQILRNGELLYDRDQAFGGFELTRRIAGRYGYAPQEAETRKRNGSLPPDYGAQVLGPFVQSLNREVARALQFFFSSTSHQRIDHILLAGGSAVLPGLAQSIARQSGFACSLANPFAGMDIGRGARLPSVAAQAASHLTSCGLALRRFAPCC